MIDLTGLIEEGGRREEGGRGIFSVVPGTGEVRWRGNCALHSIPFLRFLSLSLSLSLSHSLFLFLSLLSSLVPYPRKIRFDSIDIRR